MKENKLKNAMRFYLLATQLKYKIRSGWDEKHWNVSKERIALRSMYMVHAF